MTEPSRIGGARSGRAVEPEMREVDADSPLRMVCRGQPESARPYFVVIVDAEAGAPRSDQRDRSHAAAAGRPTGRWTLTLDQVRALTDAFVSLVSDMAAKSALEPNEQGGLDVFLEHADRVAGASDRPHRPSVRERAARLDRGALVRLRVRRARPPLTRGRRGVERAHWAAPKISSSPLPAITFEVKSLRPESDVRRDQLERSARSRRRHLAVVTVEDAADRVGGITLPGLVTVHPGAELGWCEPGGVQPPIRTSCSSTSTTRGIASSICGSPPSSLRVSEDFPALRRSQLPSAIARTTYRLDLDQLPQFIVSRHELLRTEMTRAMKIDRVLRRADEQGSRARRTRPRLHRVGVPQEIDRTTRRRRGDRQPDAGAFHGHRQPEPATWR